MLQFHRLKLLIVAISLCVGGLHAATLTDNDNTNFTITGEINLAAPNLSDANLIAADLFAADLFGANLSDANLFGANLRDANLRDANLSDANLSGAELDGARFQNTLYDSSTTFDNGFTDSGLVLVPEPSSTALLGLGGLALMLRRRR
jgi:uncharacterized protein YjbI with pentapeptide repeats